QRDVGRLLPSRLESATAKRQAVGLDVPAVGRRQAGKRATRNWRTHPQRDVASFETPRWKFELLVGRQESLAGDEGKGKKAGRVNRSLLACHDSSLCHLEPA